MASPWIDQKAVRSGLERFFQGQQTSLSTFGTTVNQTFEAFVFASVIKWYQRQGWKIEFRNPELRGSPPNAVRLKFSTRRRPENYTYAVCTKGQETIEVRHGLRVATKYSPDEARYSANIVLDVAVILSTELSDFGTNDAVHNSRLITFGEAKHMSAFAELVAGFLGLVHEMKPDALRKRRPPTVVPTRRAKHPMPFLYVSGVLYQTAEGIIETTRQRGFRIRVYDGASEELYGEKLPVAPMSSRKVYSK